MDEDIERRGVPERMLRTKHHALGAEDLPPAGRQAGHTPAVLCVTLRPIREHLPRAYGVQFFDAVEEEKAYVAALALLRLSGSVMR
jgi:hypothetical protein